MNQSKIKVIKKGPYLVTGHVKLLATTIVPVSNHYEYKPLKTYKMPYMERTESLEGPELTLLDDNRCALSRLCHREQGKPLEIDYEPAIEIITNEDNALAGPIFVKGGIPLEGDDGTVYEKQNRYALCRCGKSIRKPF